MKTKLLMGMLIALALVASYKALPSTAQTPEPTPTNDSPFTAVYADFREHYLSAGMAAWYKFDYGGGNKPISIVIPNGGLLGLEFRVYTPEQGRNILVEDKFVARVAPRTRVCAGGEICVVPDLIWRGAFPVAGTYYVRVSNPSTGWRTFFLFVTGENVSHGVPTPTPTLSPVVSISPLPPAPTITTTVGVTTPTTATEITVTVPPIIVPPLGIPTPTPARAVENDSPYTAVYVRDNREQNIPAKSDMWYKFDYGGDKSRVMIILYNGNVSGLWFAIFDPHQAVNFTENKFIGRGMPQPILCEQGKCTGNDLVWVGAFPVAGTYYIRVRNPNDQPWTFKLHIEGNNINIIE